MREFATALIGRARKTRQRLMHGESGQGLVEYALIIAIVCLGAVIALGFLSGKIQTLFSKTGNSVNNVTLAAGSGGPPPPSGGTFSGDSAGTNVYPSSSSECRFGSVTSSLAMSSSTSSCTGSSYGQFTFATASTVSNLTVTLSTNNNGGNTMTATIMRNGSPTGISCSIASGASTCSSGASQAFGIGDTMNIRFSRTMGSPSGTLSGSWSLAFT